MGMELHEGQELARRGPTHRGCSWCGTEIAVLRRPGRPRLYCSHACRQRAYEHRHGFRHPRTQRSLPGQTEQRPLPPRATAGTGYERGGLGYGGAIVHALRTSVRPDGDRRETLCGVLAVPAGRHFSAMHPAACRTCTAVAINAPLRQRVEPSNELARLRAIIDETTQHRNDPADAVAWLVADHPIHYPMAS
jgi:hypothetical protein